MNNTCGNITAGIAPDCDGRLDYINQIPEPLYGVEYEVTHIQTPTYNDAIRQIVVRPHKWWWYAFMVPKEYEFKVGEKLIFKKRKDKIAIFKNGSN